MHRITRHSVPPFVVFLSLSLLFVPVHSAAADSPDPASEAGEQADQTVTQKQEKWNSGWSLYLDNDAMVGQDDEYTGGLAVTLSGRRAAEWFWSLDPVLGFLNDLTGFSSLGGQKPSFTRHSMEIGMTGFTPEDITTEDPIEDDHPYAGLVFLNNVRQRTIPDEGITYKSVFSLGVLGTEIVPSVQRVTHDITGSDDPEGWDNQISDGGEPTFRYTLLRQDLLYQHRDKGAGDFELKSTVGGSLGYVTQLQGGLNFRWGRLTSPSWSFSPDFAEYVNMGSPVLREDDKEMFPHEFYLWGGIHGRVRGYNALIEGQFRDSDVTFDRSELRNLVGEASLGVTCGFQTGTRVSLGVRARTPEIIDADGSRPVWGTLMISQAY